MFVWCLNFGGSCVHTIFFLCKRSCGKYFPGRWVKL